MDNKFLRLFQSRKFWALVTSLVAVLAAYLTGEVDVFQALQAAIAALAGYSIGTGLDNG